MQLTFISMALVLINVGAARVAPAQHTPPTVQIPGTYSDLKYDSESGDLIGLEITIVPIAGERLQAVILSSEGEPSPLLVVEVHVKEHTISFDVAPNDGERWSFRGTVAAKSLKGTIDYHGGTKRAVTLVRRCGYWDHQ
jgi:hypothetical protein